MRVISVGVLRDFWAQHSDAEQPLKTWFSTAKKARWASPADIKAQFGTASILQNNRVVFNIGGNKFRLVVVVLYNTYSILIKFIGTHEQYDRIDAQTIEIERTR